MLIALIVVAVLAVGLLIVLLLTRSSAAEFRALADQRESALLTERDSLNEHRAQLGRELTAARTETERRAREVASQTAEVRRLGGELDKARTVAAEQNARIESQSNEIAALVADNNELQQQLEQAVAAQAEAEEAAAAAEARSAGLVIGQVVSVDGEHPEALWDLEVARSERTWRNSVAVDPTTPTGPFEATDDPVRLAVEIEAAALRENVGAFITIDWQAAPVDDPARCHLIVRVAQELLEAAARNPEPLRLVATGSDEVRLELQPIETDDTAVAVPAPRFATDLVDVRTDTGLSVTVKAD